MSSNFSLNIDSISDNPECYEYEISFLHNNGVRFTESGTCPSIEMCFDSGMNFYSEVMHGYLEDDYEDDDTSLLVDEDFD